MVLDADQKGSFKVTVYRNEFAKSPVGGERWSFWVSREVFGIPSQLREKWF